MVESWRLKVRRAEKHFQELQAELGRYALSHTFEAVRVVDGPPCSQHPNCWRYRLRVTHQPGPNLAIVAGDILHNARSALDHLAVAVAPPGRRRSASFPIELEDIWARRARRYVTRDPAKRRRFQSAVAGMPIGAIALIREVQPYHRGAKAPVHALYLLSRSRTPTSIGSSYRSLPGSMTRSPGQAPEVRASTSRCPICRMHTRSLRTGHVVAHFGYRSAPGEPPLDESEVKVQVTGTPRVAFKVIEEDQEQRVLPGFMPLTALLDTILTQIRDHIIPVLEPFVPRQA